MKDARHHLGRVQRDVIRAARREAAEAALQEQNNHHINGQEAKVPHDTAPPKYGEAKAA